jgi:ribosome-binding factor A
VVSTVRAQRIAARIQEELSDILLRESSDPRLAGVSVTDVKVDRELEYASIHVSALEGSERAQDILDGLKHAQGFLRSELAQRIELRVFPRLRFYWDPTFERAERLESLFASLDAEKKPEDLSPPETEADSSSGYEEELPDSSEAETDE